MLDEIVFIVLLWLRIADGLPGASMRCAKRVRSYGGRCSIALVEGYLCLAMEAYRMTSAWWEPAPTVPRVLSALDPRLLYVVRRALAEDKLSHRHLLRPFLPCCVLLCLVKFAQDACERLGLSLDARPMSS